MRPSDLMLMRAALAAVWIASGILPLGIFPQEESLHLLDQVGLHDVQASIALYGSALLDIAFGLLTLTHPARLLWKMQGALIVAYSTFITVFLPQFWLHPFGPVLKNIPILVLLWLLHEYWTEEIP